MQSLYSKAMLKDARDNTLIKELQKRVLDAWRLYILQLHTLSRVIAETENYYESQQNRHIKVMNEDLISLKILRNKFLSGVTESEGFEDIVDEKLIRNLVAEDTIKVLFKQLLTKEFFKTYNEAPASDDKSEYKIIHSIFKKVMLKSDTYMSEIEQHFLGWTDDAQLVIKATNKALKNFFDKGEVSISAVLPEINWKQTNDYLEEIYLKVRSEQEQLNQLIDPVIKNWDASRLNLTDHLLIKMAVCEFLHFPSIPVKVTINEYIEISKTYSTPKSKDFINGVLDKILKQLQKDNLIKKQGRGLIN